MCGLVVCKLLKHSMYVCLSDTVHLHTICRKHRFELLINVDRAARLEWKPYSRYAGVPEGAVAAVDESSASVVGDNDIFIGRHLSHSTSTISWLPGSIEVPRRSANFGVMRVFNAKGNMSEENSGDILVEVEPVRYELELHASLPDDEPQRTKKVLRSDVVLAQSSLFRFDEGKDTEARMQKVLSYEYEKSEYYGQVPGMLRALPTTIRLPNGQGQSVLWGLAEKSQQHETIMVGHALKHFRAVDVSVVGVRITEETPYRATLSAIFPDGSRRQRRIDGVVQRIYLDNIRPEYSRVYHIKEAAASKQPQHTSMVPVIPLTSTLKPGSSASHLSKSEQPTSNKDFQYKDTNGLRDSNMAKDKILSEHQLLMSSTSSEAAASTTTASVHHYFPCLLLLVSKFMADIVRHIR